MRTEDYRVLAIVHSELGDTEVTGLLERASQQSVRALPSLFGHQVIGGFEINGVHFIEFDKFEDFHRLGGLRLDLLDLFRLDNDVLTLAILVALHNLTAVHHDLFFRTYKLLLETDVVCPMQHVKRNALTARAGEKPHGHRYQSES